MAAAKDGPVQLNLRVSPDLAEKLDAWVEEINKTRSWPKVTRTDVLRSLLERAVSEKPDWIGKLHEISCRPHRGANNILGARPGNWENMFRRSTVHGRHIDWQAES